MRCTALLMCEKVIIDKEGAHSLINLMLSAQITAHIKAPGGEQPIELPPNAIAPTQWWIYTQWEPSSDDVGKSFTQKYEVYWPNGDRLADGKLSFVQTNERLQQSTFYIAGFPVGQTGRVKVVTWLEMPEGQRVCDDLINHILIEHLREVPSDRTPSHVIGFGARQSS
jgi:hypothetical protein